MNREQAETLLAALVADELDEPQRGELLAYLKTDAVLSERVGDMRLAARLLREGLEQAWTDAPTAMDDAQRAELLALVEREPITADAPAATSKSGLGPLFSIRIAGGIAACVALGVGLVGIMLPEQGEARRSARRMQSSTVDEYAYGDFGFSYSPEPEVAVPSVRLSDAPTLGGIDGTLRTDKLAIIVDRSESGMETTDGRGTSQLLDEVSGSLALGIERNDNSRRHAIADKDTGREYWSEGADNDKPAIATAEPGRPAAPSIPTPMEPAPLPEPVAETGSSIVDRPGGGQGGGNVAGLAQAGEWSGSIVWNDNHAGYRPASEFDTRYGNERKRHAGQKGQQSAGDSLFADGGDTTAAAGDLVEGVRQPAPTTDPSTIEQSQNDYDDFAKDLGSKVKLRRIGPSDAPDELAWKSAGLSSDTGQFGSISLGNELPDGVMGTAHADKDTVRPQDRIPDSVTFSLDLSDLDRYAELPATRERTEGNNRRLADNYLRIQEEDKKLAEQLGLIPGFDPAPGFDLNDALSNSSSGGGSGGSGSGNAPADDLFSQARANTAAEKHKEAEQAMQLRRIKESRRELESSVFSETQRRKTDEIQAHLKKARALQLEKNYDQALAELDAALFLEPDNTVIKGLRGMIQDTAIATESFNFKRQRDLEIASQTLQNIEATTPYADILTYPGDWPELTALRLRGLEGIEAQEKESKQNVLPSPTPEPAPEVIADKTEPAVLPVNPWVLTEQDAQSTFALDTDTASYDLTRRSILQHAKLPPIASVRMEEFVNRFDYQYPPGRDAHDTFTVHAQAGPAPFAASGATSGGGDSGAVLLKVGVRGRVVARDQMKPAHYVFVIDASGSMAREDRLPLVQQSLAMLLGQLGEQDTVSLVSYETRPYLLLENAPASDPKAIMAAAATIQTGGSTNLTDGLKLGYQVASRHYAPGSVNRVILCSDGVANVGDDDAKQMLQAVNAYRKHGVTLMTVGVGVDGQTSSQAASEVTSGGASGGERFNDGLMEQLANQGDGQYVYLGSVQDAQRQFVTDLAATRPTIAYDAKIQVQFDPSRVRRYRLIGYENRDIADKDFRNDAVDAGEVGSGQSATALYEVELWPTRRRRGDDAGNLGTVYVRYRDARSGTIQETQTPLTSDLIQDRTVADHPRFYLAACAAEFAELLRQSEHAADGSLSRLHRIANEVAQTLPLDKDAAELAELIGRADGLPRAGQ